MFNNEIAINEFLLGLFAKIANDISDESLFVPSPGHGHPPIWILGHLAMTGEMGEKLLGGTITHPEWMSLFGPGSSDKIAPTAGLDKTAMTTSITEIYSRFRTRAAKSDPTSLSRPHGLNLFEGTSIKTVEHLLALLLTNHFAYHLSQLSSCRRTAGFGPLF